MAHVPKAGRFYPLRYLILNKFHIINKGVLGENMHVNKHYCLSIKKNSMTGEVEVLD